MRSPPRPATTSPPGWIGWPSCPAPRACGCSPDAGGSGPSEAGCSAVSSTGWPVRCVPNRHTVQRWRLSSRAPERPPGCWRCCRCWVWRWAPHSAPIRRGIAAGAGIACAVLLGGLLGGVTGVGVAITCAWLFARLEPRAVRERRARLLGDLPVAIDLLAACLRGGSSWAESVDAVATALGGPVGTELHGVAARIRLGADPAATWLALADEPALAALARTAARASESGSALAATLARLAEDQRRTARAEATARARAAGVRAVGPLGLCFLPAFVLIGIVPVITGI